MPCFSCICFREGRGRSGERLEGGRGFCVKWNKIYNKYHDCGEFAPTWGAPFSGKRKPLDEPGCFLSSACAEHMGLPDDCRELTILRAFRDGVLLTSREGRLLVEEYYRIAPPLVEKINASPGREEIYREIYRRILLCIEAIEKKEHRLATELYREMVEAIPALL